MKPGEQGTWAETWTHIPEVRGHNANYCIIPETVITNIPKYCAFGSKVTGGNAENLKLNKHLEMYAEHAYTDQAGGTLLH